MLARMCKRECVHACIHTRSCTRTHVLTTLVCTYTHTYMRVHAIVACVNGCFFVSSAMLEDLVGQFSDNVIRRHALIMNHLQAVQNVLSSPDPVALACATVEHLAAMQDGRNAASSSDDQRQRRAMRKLLAHIGPHPRQMQQFHQQSEIFRRIYAVRSASQEAIEDIRRQVCRQNELTGDAMSILRSILTPVQMARFFVWAERDVESAQDLVNGPVLSSNPPSDNPTTTDSSAQPSDHSFPDDGSGY